MKNVTLPVQGMHCHSCEMIIESTLKDMAHVTSVKAHKNSGLVDIGFADKEPDFKAIEKAIEKLGYHVGEKEKLGRLSKSPKDYMIFFGILIGLYVVYMILQNAGISFDNLIDAESPSLGVVFLVGLTAGISSCMALVGGLILAISAKRNENNEKLTAGARIIPQLYFNAGRILGFALLGGLLGLFGSVIKLCITSMSVLTVVVGIVMILLGINLSHISPKLSTFSLGLPKSLSKGIDKHQNHPPKISAFVTGFLTFFLPCGFTFAMQVYAISTGNFWQGAIVMGVFALGTLPGLLGIGTIASFVKGNFAKYFYRFVGVLVLLLGLYNISHSYTILKHSLPTTTSVATSSDSQTASIDEEEIINMTYTDAGLQPATVNLVYGKKYKILIDVQTDVYGCMSTILLPGLDENAQLVKKGNQLTFNIDANQKGTFDFVCAMGLQHGAQVVIQ